MVDRPKPSTSRAGRPRMRSRSMHLPSHISVAPKVVKPTTKSAWRIQVKGKGKGADKVKSTNKKSGKTAAVVSSDSEDLEVDFPLHPPNQPHEIPAEQPQEPNSPAEAPAGGQQETDHPLDVLIEDPHQPADVPAGDAEQLQFGYNIAGLSHLLKRVDFDTIVDHLALMHIIKSKMEPATTRIKRLLELISSYSFNLYYMKAKDMILSDFLSRQKNNDSNPHEIISYLLICVKS